MTAVFILFLLVRQSALFYKILVKYTYIVLFSITVSDVHNYSIVNTCIEYNMKIECLIRGIYPVHMIALLSSFAHIDFFIVSV